MSIAEHDRLESVLSVRDYAEVKLKNVFVNIGRVITANQISASRLLGGAVAIGIHAVSNTGGALTYAANTALDWVDGAVARARNERTKEGPIIDPLVDKLVNTFTMAYLAYLYTDNRMLLGAMAASIAVDITSQVKRGPLVEQLKMLLRSCVNPSSCTPLPPEQKDLKNSADVRGKIKFATQSAAIGALMFAGQDPSVQYAGAAALAGSAVIGAMGIQARKKKAAIEELLQKEVTSEP